MNVLWGSTNLLSVCCHKLCQKSSKLDSINMFKISCTCIVCGLMSNYFGLLFVTRCSYSFEVLSIECLLKALGISCCVGRSKLLYCKLFEAYVDTLCKARQNVSGFSWWNAMITRRLVSCAVSLVTLVLLVPNYVFRRLVPCIYRITFRPTDPSDLWTFTGQDSPWKSQSEWQKTEINGESRSIVWLTLGSTNWGWLKNRTKLYWM